MRRIIRHTNRKVCRSQRDHAQKSITWISIPPYIVLVKMKNQYIGVGARVWVVESNISPVTKIRERRKRVQAPVQAESKV